MKKVLNVVLSLALCASMLLSVGCGRKQAANTASDVELVFWSTGTGTEYMDALVARFKELRPDINVMVTPTSAVQNMDIYNNPDSTVDLYFTTFELFRAYTQYLEPLDDVLAAESDGTTIAAKVGDTVVEQLKAEDGHSYAVPWNSSANGMVYNKTVFGQKGYREPRTSGELQALALTMASDGYTPFIYYYEYMQYFYDVWFAQYSGTDEYFNAWKTAYTDANGTLHERTVDAFTNKEGGRYAAMNALYNLISPKGYVYTGSNSFDHTKAQTFFVNGKALMMPNGSWLENEIKNTPTDYEFAMMRIPVVSSLGTKLGLTETQLRLCVSYVDGETLTEEETAVVKSLSPEKVDAVRAARKISYTERANHHAVIPVQSTAKDAAKDFLKFYFSDEAIRIAADVRKTVLPHADLSSGSVSTEGWSEFGKSSLEIAEGFDPIFKSLSDKFFYNNGIRSLYHYDPVLKFAAAEDSDRRDITRYWDEESLYWTESWPTLLRKAGLA